MNHVVNKRELRTLNERLEMYVRNQQEKTRMASALKKELALQEKEHRERVRLLVDRHESVEQSLRNQNAALETQQQQLYQEIATMKQFCGLYLYSFIFCDFFFHICVFPRFILRIIDFFRCFFVGISDNEKILQKT